MCFIYFLFSPGSENKKNLKKKLPRIGFMRPNVWIKRNEMEQIYLLVDFRFFNFSSLQSAFWVKKESRNKNKQKPIYFRCIFDAPIKM